MVRDVPISARATPAGLLHVLPAEPGLRVTLLLRVPSGACPVSGNPLLGALRLSYVTAEATLEVVSLRRRLHQLASGGAESAGGLERLCAQAAREVADAIGAPVCAVLWAVVRPGLMLVRVTAEIEP